MGSVILLQRIWEISAESIIRSERITILERNHAIQTTNAMFVCGVQSDLAHVKLREFSAEA